MTKPIPTWRQMAVGFVEEPISVSAICMEQEIHRLRTRLAEVERDAMRYQAIRNPPYSDRHGDLYAMTFQGNGDIPVEGVDLDNLADASIQRTQKEQA